MLTNTVAAVPAKAGSLAAECNAAPWQNPNEPITIKKYANRRLYNTGTSTYVTLEDLATMVKAGEDFVVYDAKTGEDITRSVLAQIIFEQENKEGQNLLPITFLRQLIRFYGDSMQMLVPRYLEVSIDSLTREQEKFREQMAAGVRRHGAVRRARGAGAAEHGDVRARVRDVHAVRAAGGAARGADKAGASRRATRRRRRRDRRSQAPDGRDAEAARPPERQRTRLSRIKPTRRLSAGAATRAALCRPTAAPAEASPTSAPCR